VCLVGVFELFGSVLLGLGQSVWIWAACAFMFALIPDHDQTPEDPAKPVLS
jgi:hypothetical protein